ncbi:MAG: hypothetical protein JM58_08145 [Peptococcaceae bacterium BICA1-8]|nr:MAG: hypothetical protein JM58_08145 [Peptococcaceae bacterium BICA1-8]
MVNVVFIMTWKDDQGIIAPRKEILLQVPEEGIKIGELLKKFSFLEKESLLYLVNNEISNNDKVIKNHNQLVIMPPLVGG